MWKIVAALGAALACVYAYYWVKENVKLRWNRLETYVDPEHHDHPWARKLRTATNDEFAGVIPGTCGQIRPGEWQCNCAEPKNGCLVLKELRSEDEPAEEITNRRGAIAAQKARSRNG